MSIKVRIPLVVLACLLMAAGSAIAQIVKLSDAGPSGAAIRWLGSPNARAGASLLRADLSGDVDRVDLIVGAPGAGPHGEGQVYILFMGPSYVTGNVSAAASAIVTGQSAGDEFGAATAAGMIVRREVDPLPPRDLVVGAPAAQGGRGAAYLFPGPFGYRDVRDPSTASFRIIGAANDRLGSNMITVDIDGDGYRDIVMSAPSTGRIYVIFGGPSLSGTRDLSSSQADLTITLNPGSVSFAAGDFNADGVKDLVVGVASAGSAGGAYLIKGKARAAFPAMFAITSADALFTGIDAGDAAGTDVEAADFDGDDVTDLVVGAPDGDGPANGRTGAGEAYVLYGSSRFGVSASLASAATTIYGARANDHLASAISAGHIRRDAPDDLMFLAPGASASADIDVVYGGPRAARGAVIDLASGIDRVLRGDPASPPLHVMVPMQVTGKGEDIVAASSQATTPSGMGILYAALSPTVSLDAATTTITVAQGAIGTATVHVRNAGTLTAGWAARTNTSWLAMTPAIGTSTALSAGDLTLTVTPGNLAPGTYHGGFTYLSNSRNLVWFDTGSVDLTVTAGSGGTRPTPTNLFGLPSDPDEGSPSGVNTPVGSNVTVVPVRDFLVRFTNVTQAGRTTVEVQPSRPGQTGVRPAAWIYVVRTTAVFTGPVTLGNAYQGFTTFDNDVRIVSGSNVDLTTSVDLGLDAVYGSTSSLPATVSIVEDRRRVVMITKMGNGSGTVRTSATPLNFDCGENCVAFLPGTTVIFTPAPASGSTFSGWSGACTGAAPTCTITMPSTRLVTSLTWNVSGPPSSGGGGGGGGGGGSSPTPRPSPAPTPSSSVPFAPSSLDATVDGSTVILTWAAPSAGPRATTYIVEAGSSEGAADLAQVDNGLSPTLVAPGVAAGTYFVRVRAVNASGPSAPSNEIVVIVGNGGPRAPSGAPVRLTATAVGGNVTLRWTPAAGARAYIIEAGSVPGARNLANFSTGSAATEFRAGGVPSGVYYVRVRAVTSAGVSAASNEARLVVGGVPSACGALSAPGQLAASVAGSVVTLTWGAAAGGPSSYVLEAGSRSGAADLVVTDVGNATSMTATSVGAGRYFVRVRAKNTCGSGTPSNEIVVTVR